MQDRALHVLEFDKIRERLATYTAFSASRELALALRPETEFVAAERLQQATDDARALYRLRPNTSVGGVRDVRPAARQAALGGLLDAESLQAVAASLESAATLRATIMRLADVLPVLSEIASDLVESSYLVAEIRRCIGARGEVLDSASPTLARIRQEVRHAYDTLKTRLDGFVASATGRTILQEPIVTVREGRYVVPVKSDFKGQIRGIVHDVSASGATVFMEPLEIVDLNNRWRELQYEEQREIERILRALSAAVGELAGPIVADVEIIAELDLHFAKAKYAEALQCVRPRLTRMGADWRLDLSNARHPLLGAGVVPVTIVLGGRYFVLVITGPNTGGKTVALKTAGLLTLMAQAGMHLPVGQGSVVPVFTDVAADIGDEQSIEQSLSTFSGHIRNIVSILRTATPNTLVLLDELGAGTDPVEGSALARAMLSYLVARRIPTIATTHYSEVKIFAHSTPGVENASVEFDLETLAPTYKLAIGTPGASNALAIATRLGLPSPIIEEARSLVSPEQAQIEDLLADLQAERDALARERQALTEARAAADRERARLAEAFAGIEQDRARIMEDARNEVLREADDLLRALQRAMATAQQAPTTSATAALAQAAAEVARERQAVARRARDRQRIAPRARPLRVGDPVKMRAFGTIGELLHIDTDKNEAEVSLGQMRARVSLADIEPVTAQVAAREHRRAHLEARPRLDVTRPDVAAELDIRGRRVDEVSETLERYLNDAYLSNRPSVRIIHGKGTGALRQVVRQFMAASPLVREWQPADPAQGGEGATVATLAL